MNGYALAQLTLADIYEHGKIGKAQDLEQALGWYKIAAKQGVPQAIQAVPRVQAAWDEKKKSDALAALKAAEAAQEAANAAIESVKSLEIQPVEAAEEQPAPVKKTTRRRKTAQPKEVSVEMSEATAETPAETAEEQPAPVKKTTRKRKTATQPMAEEKPQEE